MPDVGAGALAKRRIIPDDVIALSVFPFLCFGWFILQCVNIHRNFVSLKRELKALEPEKTSENRLSVRSAVATHVADKGDVLINTSKRDEKLNQRRHSEFTSRSPMSFLELKRLPPLQTTDQGLVVWPLPYRQDKSPEFPAPLKHRKGLALPKIEINESHERSPRRSRLQSSPAVLSHVVQNQLAKINRDDPLKPHTTSSHDKNYDQ